MLHSKVWKPGFEELQSALKNLIKVALSLVSNTYYVFVELLSLSKFPLAQQLDIANRGEWL